jgi:diguanylate cyclase (GGDEF)-like protein/PAS domain S-box-containing protein
VSEALRRPLENPAILSSLSANVREGIYIADSHGEILDANQAFLDILGVRSIEELERHQSYTQMVDPTLRTLEAELLRRDGSVRDFEFQIRRPGGDIRTVLDSCKLLVDPTTTDIVFHGILVDVTERRATEASLRDTEEQMRHSAEALRRAEDRYALAMRGANDGLWEWDIAADSMLIAPRWKEILGYAADEITGHPDEWFSRVHPEDAKPLHSALQQHMASDAPPFQFEHRVLHRSGAYVWVLCRGLALRDAEGRAMRMAGSLTDITERKAAEQQFQNVAFRDALTGLANRGLFEYLLGRAAGKLRRDSHYLFGVMFLDLDRFAQVNERMGRGFGDLLLTATAQRLERCVRPGDAVARLAGDAFAILLDGLRDTTDATRVADRIERELSRPFELEGQRLSATASVGIALNSTGFDHPEQLLRDAETAMQRAQTLGTGRCEVFDRHLHKRAVAQLQFETDLRQALDRDEFRVHYQPIVSLETGRIESFEALVRWQHPTRGLLMPTDFIELTEKMGLTVPLGRFVLHEACDTVRRVGEARPGEPLPGVSVNLSSKQLHYPAMAEQIRRALEESGIPPDHLRLEIAEDVVMESAGMAMAILAELRELGVQLHLDGFGIGHSSLGHLPRLQVHALKVDRDLVGGAGAGHTCVETLRVIAVLARNLGLGVVAQGVETAEQLVMVRESGCSRAQGYYLSKPVPAEEVPGLLSGPALA